MNPAPSVRTKVWIETAGSRVFGSGLARLLENIERFGSLRRAADEAGMSYRYAWNLIGAAEDDLRTRLIIRRTGGSGGGGSALSAEGRRLLGIFRALSREVADFADARFGALCADGGASE